MRSSPWMDEIPAITKTPLQIAKENHEHWLNRLREALYDARLCEMELNGAHDALIKVLETP